MAVVVMLKALLVTSIGLMVALCVVLVLAQVLGAGAVRDE